MAACTASDPAGAPGGGASGRPSCGGEDGHPAVSQGGAPLALLPLMLAAGAVWPVWGYLWRNAFAPGGDPAGLLALLLALVWALGLWAQARREGGGSGVEARRLPGAGILAGTLLLGGYAAAYPSLPALARALIGLAAVGSLLLVLPGVGWRERSGLLALWLLAAPPPDTLAFFLGGPLRAASAGLAALWLQATGVLARAEGPALWVGARLISVDAPCSGVNGLWSGAVVAAALAAGLRLSPLRTLALLGGTLPLGILANGWRAASLVYLPGPTSVEPQADPHHAALGLLVFAVTAALLLWMGRQLAPRAGQSEPRLHSNQAGTGGLRAPAGRYGGALAAASLGAALLAAGLVPLLPTRAAAPAATPAPQWPVEWLGQPLRRLPPTDLDRRWARMMPGPLARFELPDGSELLLRSIERPGRGVHPPEDCYRGQGFRVRSLAPVRAPVPGAAAPGVWGRFRAERGAEAWEVRSLLLSHGGAAYSDPAWWWWRVSGPGAVDRGPWWMVTLQRRAGVRRDP